MRMRRMLGWMVRGMLGKERFERLEEKAFAMELQKAIVRHWPAGTPAPCLSIDEGDDDGVIRAGSVKPGEPRKVYVTRHGVVINDAQGITLHALDGSTVTMHPDGSHETRDPAIRRIAIHDVQQIVGMRSARVYDTVSHTIDFLGGGTLAYVADLQGKLLEVMVRGMACTTETATGVMTVYQTGEVPPADREVRSTS